MRSTNRQCQTSNDGIGRRWITLVALAVATSLLPCLDAVADEPPLPGFIVLPDATVSRTLPGGDGPPSGEPQNDAANANGDLDLAPSAEPGEVVAQFHDGGRLAIRLKDDALTLDTPHGQLVIPVKDIRSIELATRLTDAEAALIAAAVRDLGHEAFDKREAATRLLAGIGVKAYAALREALNSDDEEVARRARTLLDELGKDVTDEALQRIRFDVVKTELSTIAGRLANESLVVQTKQFGEQTLKLADVRMLALPSAQPAVPKNVRADPGHLAEFRGHVGKVFAFRVTGAATSSIWGSDLYTLDSSLATAAVHAGLVKVGETKVVLIKILGPTDSFLGSTRHGVTSHTYSQYPGAYEFVK